MPATQIQRAARPTNAAHDPLADVLADLYRQQLDRDPASGYIRSHATPAAVDNQVRTFRWYEPFLPAGGAALDWGCRHAPDSCMLRAEFGDRFELHGCDFVDPHTFQPFHDYAGFDYRQLDDTVALPYAKDSFDVVIASGVLEHVALEHESLKELFRVIKPDGRLIISYLPNLWSLQEWRLELLRGYDYHQRRYRLSEACRLLKAFGFCPIEKGYHTFFWERLGVRRGSAAGKALRTLFPVHWFCSTLCVVAIKVAAF